MGFGRKRTEAGGTTDRGPALASRGRRRSRGTAARLDVALPQGSRHRAPPTCGPPRGPGAEHPPPARGPDTEHSPSAPPGDRAQSTPARGPEARGESGGESSALRCSGARKLCGFRHPRFVPAFVLSLKKLGRLGW